MPDFSPIITQAYLRILERAPDLGGLNHFNQQMNAGMAESAMREALLRSLEYAQKHPDRTARRGTRPRAASERGRSRPRKPKRASPR